MTEDLKTKKVYALSLLQTTLNTLVEEAYNDSQAPKGKEEAFFYTKECLQCASKLADLTAYVIAHSNDSWGGAPLNIAAYCKLDIYVWVDLVSDAVASLFDILKTSAMSEQVSSLNIAMGNICMLCIIIGEALADFEDTTSSLMTDLTLSEEHRESFIRFYYELEAECVKLTNELFDDSFQPKKGVERQVIENSFCFAVQSASERSGLFALSSCIDSNKSTDMFCRAFPRLFKAAVRVGEEETNGTLGFDNVGLVDKGSKG